MDAAFCLEHSESVRALDAEIHVLEAGFFARLLVVFFDLPTLAFGVALVHPVKHLDPVASLRAALAGVNAKNGVGVIVFPTEIFFEFQEVNRLLELGKNRI